MGTRYRKHRKIPEFFKELDTPLFPSWYRNKKVFLEILRQSKDREIAVIESNKDDKRHCIRNLNMQSIEAYKFMYVLVKKRVNNNRNLYYSSATYRDEFPYLKHDSREYEEWEKSFKASIHEHITGIDLLIDIDLPDHSSTDTVGKYSMLQVHKTLNYLNCPHEIRFSGKGFHVIVPYRYFSHLGLSFNSFTKDRDSLTSLYKDVSSFLHDKVTETIDTGIYDVRRVIKMPYSFVNYKSIKEYICWPIHGELEVQNFNLFDARPEICIQKITGNRGLYVFNVDGNVNDLCAVAKCYGKIYRKNKEKEFNKLVGRVEL